MRTLLAALLAAFRGGGQDGARPQLCRESARSRGSSARCCPLWVATPLPAYRASGADAVEVRFVHKIEAPGTR